MSVCLYSLKKYFETNTFPTALQTFFLIQQKRKDNQISYLWLALVLQFSRDNFQ